MKKILSVIIAIMVYVTVSAQTSLPNRTSVSSPSSISGPTYCTFWGDASDTLTASDTITQVIRIKGDGVLQIEMQLDRTKVSGTVTNNFFIARSLDGTNWTNVDTVAHSNVSTGVTLLSDSEFTNWNWPYMRIQGISGATAQKAWYKGWLIVRY